MVLHYDGKTVYPADMSYLGLREALERYDEGGCPDKTLGSALKRRLDQGKRRTLVALLPRTTATRVRRALAAVR